MLTNVVNASIEHKMVKTKLRVLCLHSFRTSAAIFKEQASQQSVKHHSHDTDPWDGYRAISHTD